MAHVLALEPYFGGSHRAFLDGWAAFSRHQLTALTYKPHHWKWRMRHAGLTFAQQLGAQPLAPHFDLVWCSSMVNLAEFFGTCPASLRTLPSAAYFHENQLTYPSRHPEPRDVHFAFTHWATIAAAREVWFNSAYNRDTLYDGLSALLRKLPDHRDAFDRVEAESRSYVLPPGIEQHCFAEAGPREPGPVRLGWASRFEHDKGPDLLLDALRSLRAKRTDFRLTILGEQFAVTPHALVDLQREFGEVLDHFGFAARRADYLAKLSRCDLFISTAQHEFFGLSVMEAAAAGCSLLLPHHQCYPRLFEQRGAAPLFYDNTASGLARALDELMQVPAALRPKYTDVAQRYAWAQRARDLDEAVDRCIGR